MSLELMKHQIESVLNNYPAYVDGSLQLQIQVQNRGVYIVIIVELFPATSWFSRRIITSDGYPQNSDPASHTIQLGSVSYNTFFLGGFSLHLMAECHGAACVVGGCTIYVSDKPRQLDFNLLKSLSFMMVLC